MPISHTRPGQPTRAQKGIDLVLAALPELLDLPVNLLRRHGEPAYEHALRDVAIRSPERVAVLAGYDEAIAHRIQASADIFLMPSRFEPCGSASCTACVTVPCL